MSSLSLPQYYVYAQFADGTRKNIAISDTLMDDEALSFWKYWSSAMNPVTRVSLEKSNGKHKNKILFAYDFDQNGNILQRTNNAIRIKVSKISRNLP